MLCFVAANQIMGQVMQPYSSATNHNSFYMAGTLQDLFYINDNDVVNNGTIWNLPPGAFEMYMNFTSPVRIDSVAIRGGQFNGDYNTPSTMYLYRGTVSTGTLLLTINPNYTYTGYNFINPSSDTLYTWLIIPNVSGYASIREITCFTECTTDEVATNVSACTNYSSPSGNYIWNSSGVYADTVLNTTGCDSIITINLTIYHTDTAVTQSSITLTSHDTVSAYQWIDCADNSILTGETSAVFTATNNGSYAVIVSNGGCIDTSGCYVINTVNTLSIANHNNKMVYPNPFDDQITLQTNQEPIRIEIVDALGNSIKIIESTENTISLHELKIGIYFLKIYTDQSILIEKIIKK